MTHTWTRPGTDDPLRSDGTALIAASGRSYPTADGIPVLLEPEATGGDDPVPDITVEPYAGVYEERKIYDAWAASDADATEIQADLEFLHGVAEHAKSSGFPEPSHGWLRASPAIGGERSMLQGLTPIEGTRCVQIGGRGVEGIALAIAGAAEVTVISPMIEELRYGRQLARTLGLSHRVRFGCAIAEELPLARGSVDRILCRHSLHHTMVSRAMAEADRVLAPGGRFASIDVWRAPLYDIGIRWFGKMTPGVNCRPLDRSRLDEIDVATLHVEETSHGALFRYPLAMVQRKGRLLSGPTSERLATFEDALARRSSLIAKQRSLVGLRGSKPPTG